MSSPWPCRSFSFNTAPQNCSSLKCCSVSPNFSLSEFYSSPLLYKRTLGRDFSPSPEWRKFSPAIWCIIRFPHHLAFHCGDHRMRQADLTLSRVFFLPRWHLRFAGWAFFRSSRPFSCVPGFPANGRANFLSAGAHGNRSFSALPCTCFFSPTPLALH